MLLDHWKHHLSSHKILTAGLDFLVPDRCDVHCEREHSVVGPTSGQCSSQLALEGSQPNGLILSFEFHAKRKSSSQTFSWPSLTVQGRSLDSNGAVFLEFFLSKCGRPELKQAELIPDQTQLCVTLRDNHRRACLFRITAARCSGSSLRFT
ncbi:hypothetical protein PTI98_002878 [Pleurotus ostreatus]|nr:hypothetical protein PTI98_002878 [Pleurotus ostreatus]